MEVRDRFLEAIDYIESRLLEPVRLSEAAESARLSPAYFSRLFRATFNTSPRRWILEERIRHAAQWMSDSELNVSEVAYRLGYENPHLFSRQFKSVFGMSPKAYRRK